MKRHLLIGLLSIFSSVGFGQGSPSSLNKDRISWINGFGMVTENDVFAIASNDDDNYTGQFQFDLYLKDIFDKGAVFPFVRNIYQYQNNNRSFYFNGQGYTPARIYFDSTSVVKTDRPYASLLNFGFQRTAWWDSLGTNELPFRLKLTTDFSVGKMGIAAPGQVQNFIHEYITTGSKEVKGWHNQVCAPGRFVFTYRAYGTAFWELLNANEPKETAQLFNKQLNVGVNADFMTGFVLNYFSLGLTFNTLGISTSQGVPHPSFQNSIRSYQKSQELLAKPNELPRANLKFRQRNKLFFELAPSVKLVGHNTLLSGHPIEDNSVYKIDKHDVNKVVFECSFRIINQRLNIRDGRIFQFTYAFNVRSREFSYGVPYHVYASLGFQTFKINN